MYSIDVTLKDSPIALSVQRKDKKDAETLYQEIRAAMQSDSSKLIELTCEKEEDKKVSLLSDRISAVILNQRSGAAGSGRATGFFMGTE